MNAKLEILSGSLAGEEFALDAPETSVGREPKRDIVFSDEHDSTVSREHATILFRRQKTGPPPEAPMGERAMREREPVWLLVDEQSVNGTFLNGERIQSGEEVELSQGDEITFGKEGPVARFTVSPAETEIVPRKTRVVASETEVVSAGEGEPQTIIGWPEATLEILSGGREDETVTLRSAEGKVRIGRDPEYDPDRDLVFSDDAPTVSRHHATLRPRSVPHGRRRAQRWFLVDEGSTNGTLVNGEPIEPGEEVALSDGDEITFGRGGPVARFTAQGPASAGRPPKETEIGGPGATEPWSGAPADGGERVPDSGWERALDEEGATVPPDGTEWGPMWEEETRPLEAEAEPGRRGPAGAGSGPDDGERTGDRTLIRRGTTWIMANVDDWEDKLRLLYGRQKRKMWRAVGATAVLGLTGSGIVFWQGKAETERVRQQAITFIQEVQEHAQEVEERAQHMAAVLRTQLDMTANELQATEAQLGRLEAAYGVLREEQEEQLRQLQGRLGFTEGIAREYRASVALVSSTLSFVSAATGDPVRAAVDASGRPILDDQDRPIFTLEGRGPVVRVPRCCGTAFLVHEDGWLLTNRHVLDPQSFGAIHEEMSALVGSPLRPVAGDFRAYFPPGDLEMALEVVALHEDVDVGLARISRGSVDRTPIPLAPARSSVSVGSDVGAIGYPTAAVLLCYRAAVPPPECASRLSSTSEGQIVATGPIDISGIAARELVQPLVQRGAISDVTESEVVYHLTGSSAGGSSGSPVLDAERRVIAVNWGGGEFRGDPRVGVRVSRAVPIRYAWELLPDDVRRDLQSRAAAE